MPMNLAPWRAFLELCWEFIQGFLSSLGIQGVWELIPAGRGNSSPLEHTPALRGVSLAPAMLLSSGKGNFAAFLSWSHGACSKHPTLAVPYILASLRDDFHPSMPILVFWQGWLCVLPSQGPLRI